jgi:hypothetical protein
VRHSDELPIATKIGDLQEQWQNIKHRLDIISPTPVDWSKCIYISTGAEWRNLMSNYWEL